MAIATCFKIKEILHNWPKNIQEAASIQEQLRNKIITKDCFQELTYIAGVDVSYSKKENICVAAISILHLSDFQEVEHKVIKTKTAFPYIPGYLSFREIPPVISAIQHLKISPDIIACDGQGTAHPKSFGLASHLGTLLDLPTMGIAKSKLVGYHDPVGINRGEWQPLIYKDKIIGRVLRTRSRVKPVYVSPGHKISLKTATELTLRLTPRFRLPETTRKAHSLCITYSKY